MNQKNHSQDKEMTHLEEGTSFYKSASCPEKLTKLRREAKESIGEVEDLIPKRIAELKTILEQDKELVPHPSSFDDFYLRCLRAKKYDVERAANLYRKFCKLRKDGSDLLNKLKPTTLSRVIQSKFISTLKIRDDLGRQLLLVRMENWNSKDVNLDDILMTLFTMMDEMMNSSDTQLFGFVAIVDFKTLSVWHAAQARPGRIRTLIKVLQDSYPARFKEFHIINNPSIFSGLFAIASLFMKEKMRNRIHFHGSDLTSLHKMLKIDSTQLPEYLGGSLDEEEYDDFTIAESVLKKDSYYEELLKYGYVKK